VTVMAPHLQPMTHGSHGLLLGYAAVARQLYNAHDPEFTNIAKRGRMLVTERADELRACWATPPRRHDRSRSS
jgi:hypothetical protein